MVSSIIKTARLSLMPVSVSFLESILKGPDIFKKNTSFELALPYTEFPESIPFTLESLSIQNPLSPWLTYAIILEESSTYIGQCGFKSIPDDDGEVEFGYEIARDFRRHGYAHEAIQALLEIAFNEPHCQTVIAHTLALKNESNHLLIKNGFLYQGTLIEENEKIWRWTLPKKVYFLRKLF